MKHFMNEAQMRIYQAVHMPDFVINNWIPMCRSRRNGNKKQLFCRCDLAYINSYEVGRPTTVVDTTSARLGMHSKYHGRCSCPHSGLLWSEVQTDLGGAASQEPCTVPLKLLRPPQSSLGGGKHQNRRKGTTAKDVSYHTLPPY